MNINKTRNHCRTGGILLAVYLILLVYFLLFCKFFGRTPGLSEHRFNLVPFREIVRFYRFWKQVGMLSAVLNLAGNLIGFVPFGLLVPVVSSRMHSWKRTVLAGFLLTVLLEVFQLILKAGIFDVDDIILNTLGTLIGYLIFLVFTRSRR